jgi:hypothetical protein
LRTAPGTYEAGSDEPERHAVAVLNDRENVLLLGDGSFLRADRFAVGDNERFVASVVEFLVSGERTSGATVDETPDDEAESEGTADGEDASLAGGEGASPSGGEGASPTDAEV